MPNFHDNNNPLDTERRSGADKEVHDGGQPGAAHGLQPLRPLPPRQPAGAAHGPIGLGTGRAAGARRHRLEPRPLVGQDRA